MIVRESPTRACGGITLVDVPSVRLADEVADLVGDGHRILTIVGTDERHESGEFGLWVVLLAPSGEMRQLRAALDSVEPRYPSITARVPSAHWDERELADLLGFIPENHPDPRPLVLREDWPRGLHPLRKDFDSSLVPPPSRHDAYQFAAIDGEGVSHIPVGPIHAGVIEPGHFRFAAVGEMVLQLEARLFYTHRGIEKLVEGRTPAAALPLVERVCGACAFSHSVAFGEAIESLNGIDIPERAVWARTIGLELERLYNHLGDAGNICAGTGFAVGAMAGARLKERIQRLIEALFGHRFLRDANAIGGLRRDLPEDAIRQMRGALPELRAATQDLLALLFGTESFLDRTRGTGVLSAETVRALGGVGVAARASGVDVDVRLDRPYAGYRRWVPARVTQTTGDVDARLRQRLDEASASWDLLAALLAEEPFGPVWKDVGPLPAHAVGVGAVESARGADVHWLRTDENGRIDRLRVRSASFANWPLVALAVPGNLVPDFPLINKSFELCYACLDR